MGNSNSTPEIFSLDSWNLSHLPDLKKYLGMRSSHLYSSYPKSIPEDLVFSRVDLRLFSCQDGIFLHNFLQNVYEHLQREYLKENWEDRAFPSNLENLKLLDHQLSVVVLTEEQKDEIRNSLNLGSVKPVESEENENSTEDSIKITYQGYCVYEFPENGLGMALDNKKVGIESCFVGSHQNRLVVMAPSEEPRLSTSVRFDWTVVQVEGGKIRLILDDARGVMYEGGKQLEDVEEDYFENLEKAFVSFEANNSREMSLHGNKFKSWAQEVKNNGELQAYAGGEVDGEIVRLTDFLDKMEVN